MQTSRILTYLAAAAVAISATTPPSLCMVSPVATVTAGAPIIATVDNPQGRPCEAMLVFSDQDFLPVSFDLQPMECLGFQQAEISVPLEAPNGDVTVLWECAGGGVQGCSRLSIDGGSADIDDLIIQQTGTMECVVPVATLTTLTTSIRSTMTIVNAVVETVLSTQTGMITTRTAEPTGRAVTTSTGRGLSGWNTTSPGSKSPSQVAHVNNATGSYPTAGSTTTTNHRASGVDSAMSNSTMTVVVPLIVPITTVSSPTTSLSSPVDSPLTLPLTVVPVPTPGSCGNSTGAA